MTILAAHTVAQDCAFSCFLFYFFSGKFLPPPLPFMRLAEHLMALRAWCKQCLPDR